MTVVIDVDKYKKKTKIRFIIHLICLSLLIAGVVIGSVFSLIKSPLDYRLNLILSKEKNIKTISNIRFRTLSFSYKEGEGTYLDNLYVLDSDIELKKGQKYSLYTYRNIIIKLEEINNAAIK